MSLTYLSVCSGIEAATVAWHPLGWLPVAFSEIDAFPSAVLAHHYPHIPNYGDMTNFMEWPDVTCDVLVGGTPCQSFSVAGLRRGLADPRGNLMLVYLALLDRIRPTWLVWENVPGVLSSNGGRDFGTFLGALGNLGYGFAYRVLDAQYFGLAQRRKRVFVVGHLGDWRRAAAVLFERESLSGYPPPRREAGQGVTHGVAPSFTASGRGVERVGENRGQDPVIPVVSRCLNAGAQGRIDGESETFIVTHALRADGFDVSEDGTGRGTPLVPVAFQTRGSNVSAGDDVAGTIGSNADRVSGSAPCIAFSVKDHGADAGDIAPTLRAGGHATSHANEGVMPAVFTLEVRGRADGRNLEYRDDGTANALRTPNGGRDGIGVGAVAYALGSHAGAADADVSNRSHAVRRLVPRECERLQGFPDDYTLIHYRGKPASDGPRYKALGNSMAVPVMRWIGRRIQMVEDLD